MSRIGKTPVLIPEKVTVDFDGLTVTVKGPKGELKRLMPEGVSFDKKDNTAVSYTHLTLPTKRIV